MSRIPTGPKIRMAPGAVTGFGPRLGDVRISTEKDDSETRGHPRYWSPIARVAKLFELNREGLNMQRRLMFVGVLPVPGIILAAFDKQQYLFSAALWGLLVGLSYAGGEFWFPARRMAAVAVVGALLSALGLGIGAGAWEIVALAAFVVTSLAGPRAAASGTAT